MIYHGVIDVFLFVCIIWEEVFEVAPRPVDICALCCSGLHKIRGTVSLQDC